MLLRNFYEMPVFLKLLTLAGLCSPVIIFMSVIFSEPFSMGQLNVFMIFLACFSSVPIAIASWKLLKKVKSGRYLYIFGWVLICVSPLAFSHVRGNIDIFIPSIIFSMVMGIAIFLYLSFADECKRYFKSNEIQCR